MTKATGNTTVINLDDGETREMIGITSGSVIVDELAGVTAAAGVVDEDADLGDLPKRAVRNGDGSVTLTLRFPVTITIRSAQHGSRQETYPALTFHRLTGADLRAIHAASEAAKEAVALARSTRIREQLMAGIYDLADAADLADASTVITSFLPSGRKTG